MAPQIELKRPKFTHVGSKRRPRAPKLSPRGAEEAQDGGQEATSEAQERPKRSQVEPKRRPREGRMSKKAAKKTVQEHLERENGDIGKSC